MNATAPRLQLLLQKVNDDLVRITWLQGNNRDSNYLVNLGPLLAAAKDLRHSLAAHLEWHRENRALEPQASPLGNLLARGRDLFAMLFMSDSTQKAGRAREIFQGLDGAGGMELAIKVDPDLTLPWGLVVAEAVSGVPQADEHGFWCLRHRLSVSTFNADWGAAGNRVDVDGLRTIAGLNRGIVDKVMPSIHVAEELSWIDSYLGESLSGTTFTSSDFVARLEESAQDESVRLRVAYLLGHGDGNAMLLSSSDRLGASQLAVALQRHCDGDQAPGTLLFINGCETATAGEHFGFSDLLGRLSGAALLGTEVKVPNRFAFRFALAFLNLVINEGNSPRDALERLRRLHLPLSLAYSLYAADGPSVASARDERVAANSSNNYSEEAVKCP